MQQLGSWAPAGSWGLASKAGHQGEYQTQLQFWRGRSRKELCNHVTVHVILFSMTRSRQYFLLNSALGWKTEVEKGEEVAGQKEEVRVEWGLVLRCCSQLPPEL